MDVEMVTKNVDNRWVRRYKAFFIIGLLILGFQLFLAFRFFSLHSDAQHSTHVWTPHREIKPEASEVENSVNSARKSKDGFVLDDEDLKYNEKQVKLKKPADKNAFSNKTNSKLRLEELDFVPACEITTREAISAIHRAKTQKCKQEISNVTCLIQRNLLYPASLPNYCASEGFIKGKSLGCFKDEKNYRLLNGYYGNNKKGNSPEYCMNMCLQSGYPFAGVQYSTECFCGNDEPPSTAKLPDSSCNMKCPSNPHLACGGYYSINIYHTGIKRFVPQIADVTTANDTPAKIAFLFTLNGRALRQIKRLIKNLFHRDHYYYIHVDVRQDYLFRELLPLEKRFPNVRLSRHRFATIWGGASLLEMLLSAMQELLRLDWKWDFVINLSESDYPVKTLSRLVKFLSANRNKNFVKSHGREVQRFIQKQGLDKTFVECDIHMWRTGDRQLPWGIQIDGGSDWIALSRKFVSYVASEYPDELVKGLFIVFKHTLLPAESFFHTVLRNSKFCNTYVDNNLHVTNWKRKLGCKCQYKHVVDWCGCSPNDFKPEDWLRIQNTESRQLFFARKFEPIINQAVILQLEQWLYKVDHMTRLTNVNSYWQSIYNYLDLGVPVDDSLLTISQGISRIKSKQLSTKVCTVNPHKILEVTSFHINDMYQKTLVLFEAIVSDYEKVSIETSLKPKSNVVVTRTSEFMSRLKYLSVCSDYDQKEQILRNFACVLGPYSDPTLLYEFNASLDSSAKTSNISFLWLDPAGHLVEISEVVVDESFTIGHIKPSFKQPLLPGSWSVKLVRKYQELAEVKFLISPLEYYSGTSVLQNQVNFIHSGTGLHKEFDSQWDSYLPSYFDQERLEQLSLSNSKRFGPDLQEWIDTLLNKFYVVGEVCIVKSAGSVCGEIMPECRLTNWSSMAPDPKSNIGSLNETTGMFDLW